MGGNIFKGTLKSEKSNFVSYKEALYIHICESEGARASIPPGSCAHARGIESTRARETLPPFLHKIECFTTFYTVL